ncbi:hypothetical protein ABFS82_02G019300 [Erythranthe guttata]|uniref:Uncharacterized protein n=1 Tax=Erythranthe guttata TaxID=4155 RepID=A0A022RCQ3_ERYGU|nr:hypothetical protein MIMGU_mgv1a014517mg [Erythranthe guttata]
MLRILKKTTSSRANSGGSAPAGEDLSAWEIVSAPQSDDEDLCSFEEEGATSGEDDVIVDEEPESKPDPEEEEEEEGGEPCGFVTPADVISIRSLSVSPPMTLPVEMAHVSVYRVEGKERRYYGENDDVSDDDDAHDVDDDLMPWKLKDKFGRQRIRKMGKRAVPNFNKAKSLPYYHNMPGTMYRKLR